MVEELKFIEGGAELLNDVRPLWKTLNTFHAAKSPHFAESRSPALFQMPSGVYFTFFGRSVLMGTTLVAGGHVYSA
jgi:hypothetical protein